MSPGGGLFSAPSCPGSIVSAATFHFRVRDGNGWVRRALTTRTRIVANSRSMSKRRAAHAPSGAKTRMGRSQWLRPMLALVAGEGFEPPTFGL